MTDQAPKQSNESKALAVVNDSLEAYRDEFTKLLGSSVDPEVFMSVAYEAARSNPDLLEVALQSPDSLMKALHDAASLKLVPNGVLGSAYIVPRRNSKTNRKEANFQVGYRGLVELIIRSGHVSHVESRIVYENDEFSLSYGTSPGIRHEPDLFADRGKVKGAYAVAFMRDGTTAIEFMSVAQIDKVKSRATTQAIWSSDYEEMCRKTVVRRLAKMLPMSVEVQRAVELDDRGEGFGEVVATVEAVPKQAAKSLAGRIRQQITSSEPEPPKTNGKAAAAPLEGTVVESEDAKPVEQAPTEEPPAQEQEPPAEPKKAKPRRSTDKASAAESAAVSGDEDTIEPSADVPDGEPESDKSARLGSLVSTAKPPRDMITWDGIIEPNPKGGAKLATDAWKGKLVAPGDDAEGQIAQFIDGLDVARYVSISGLLELVPWNDANGKAMPPYRKIIAYVIEVGSPVEQ